MQIVLRHDEIAAETFPGGATYKTLVGGAAGAAPVTVGEQTCPPGYRTRVHAHPYLEVIIVHAGRGEAWVEGRDDMAVLEPGVTLALPAGTRHWFAATGPGPLVIYGVHASPRRIVEVCE